MSTFYTDDLDHAIEFVTARSGEHSRIAHGRGAFEFGFLSFSGTAVAFGSVRRALRHTLRVNVPESISMLHLPVAHEGEYRIGRKVLRSSPVSAVLLSPGIDYTLREPCGAANSVVVRTEDLMNALDADWQGRRGHLALAPFELKLSMASRSQLLSLWCDWKNIGCLPSVQQDVRAVVELEHRMVAWLAGEIAAQAGLRPLSPRSRHRVQALSRWMDSHLGENVDLGRLAEVAGVGPRALAKLCEAARGVSPMQMLQERRLAAAHRLLAQGAARTNVARVAHEVGCAHLGRFAGAYRAVYGESPSDTLARSRQRNIQSPDS